MTLDTQHSVIISLHVEQACRNGKCHVSMTDNLVNLTLFYAVMPNVTSSDMTLFATADGTPMTGTYNIINIQSN